MRSTRFNSNKRRHEITKTDKVTCIEISIYVSGLLRIFQNEFGIGGEDTFKSRHFKPLHQKKKNLYLSEKQCL